MKSFARLLTSALLSLWLGLSAILAIQNFTPVTLRFFTLESTEIPLGIVLVLSAAIGLMGTAIVQTSLIAQQRDRS